MTMILDPAIASLGEYLRLKHEQQAADQAKPGLRRKHQYLVPKRPTACPECSAEESFWVKAYFFRWAVEADLREVLPVPRYVCRQCNLVVSVLFAFLVPYRQLTVAAIGEAVQNYLAAKTTYREAAEAVSGSNDVQRPNHSQVWHWVDLLAGRAVKQLNVRLQRACILAGKERCVPGLDGVVCPNAKMAQSLEKVRQLNCGAGLLVLANVLLQQGGDFVAELQACFSNSVQPALSILTGRALRLYTPQSSQHVIW